MSGERISRRDVLTSAAGAGTGLVLGRALSSPSRHAEAGAPSTQDGARVDFFGVHQAGITAPVRAVGLMAAFDVVASDLPALRDAFTELSHSIRRLMSEDGPEPRLRALPPEDRHLRPGALG